MLIGLIRPMNYKEIIIHVPDESRDALTARLSEMGMLGLVENNKTITVYFDCHKDLNQISDELLEFKTVLKASGLDPDISFESKDIPGQDWNEEWKKFFAPIDAGDNFVIVPSWLDHETDRIKLVIDPGMAFGTGQHATTFMCLELLEKYAGDHKIGSMLDVGTGTGVLAIASSKLGFSNVTAVDIDHLAVDATRMNAELNGIQSIDIRQGDIQAVNGTYDLITANILSGILIEIASDISERLNKNGIAIMSGILVGQEDGVIDAMQKAGLTLKEKTINDKWVAIVLYRG